MTSVNMTSKDKLILFTLLTIWSVLNNLSFGFDFRITYIIVNITLFYTILSMSLRTAQLYVLVLSFVSFILFPLTAKFGKPDINMVAAFGYSNSQEIKETVVNLSFTWILAGILTFITGLELIRYSKKININNHRLVITCILISLCIIFYKPVFAHNGENIYDKFGYPPLKIIRKIYLAEKNIKETEELIVNSSSARTDFQPEVRSADYDTLIMVIGESVRRDYMNLYGFGVDNTPFLSSSNGIIFENYVSASFATVPSVTNSLVRLNEGKKEYHNSVIRLAKESGLRTYWISNQGRFGVHDGPIAAIGKQADYSFFIKKGDYDGSTIHYRDESLLPEIEKAMRDKEQKLIVIHLEGSHPDPCKRTDGEFSVKYINNDLSCYIQSIKNTDSLLKKISEIADKGNNKWSMLYFSDHGLAHSKDTGKLTHMDSNRQNYMPPFLIINSDSKDKKRITALRSGLDFQKMFAQWAGIKEPLLESQCDYFSETNCIKHAKVIDGNMKLRAFQLLANDPAK